MERPYLIGKETLINFLIYILLLQKRVKLLMILIKLVINPTIAEWKIC